MSRHVLCRISAFVLALGMSAPAAAQIEVTSCGQGVPAGETGFLSGDLDCSAYGGPADAAVYLDKNAALDLGGFTLTGADYGVVCGLRCDAAVCTTGTCKVRNGRVTGA